MPAVTVQWVRYGHWAAHLQVDGVQACNTRHGKPFMGNPVNTFHKPEPAELAPCGLPFGRVCGACQKRWRSLVAEARRA